MSFPKFTSEFDLTAIRKAQGKVKSKYNRVGRAIDKMGLSAEDNKAIEAILQTSFDRELKSATENAQPAAAAASPMV